MPRDKADPLRSWERRELDLQENQHQQFRATQMHAMQANQMHQAMQMQAMHTAAQAQMQMQMLPMGGPMPRVSLPKNFVLVVPS